MHGAPGIATRSDRPPELVRSSGVQIPPFTHHHAGSPSVLVIDRFDRVGDHRIGQLSDDGLLGKQAAQVTGSPVLGEALTPLSNSPPDDSQEPFRSIAVALMIENVDDHPESHGLIRGARKWRLSPSSWSESRWTTA